MQRSQSCGFTLIELIVAVAIVAILAAIALPSFQDQMRKSRRAEAVATMQEQQLLLERWRVDRPTYATYALPANLPGRYTYAFEADATSYKLTATPQGDQQKDSCGTLTLQMSAGVTTKTPATANCW